MTLDVVIVPAAPLLLPEYQGRVPAAPGLLEACVAAVRAAVGTADHVVVVHATDREPRSTRPPIGLRVADHLLATTHVGFSVEHASVAWDASVEECVRVGQSLATDPRLRAPLRHGTPTEGPPAVSQRGTKSEPTTLLVVADGSARRTEKAPGHLDPRAAGVDQAIVDAIRGALEGGLDGLLELDPGLCSELLVAGRAPLQVLAAAIGPTTSGSRATGAPEPRTQGGAAGERTAYGPLEVLTCEVSDPFGVLYVVAHLRASG